MPKSPVRKKQNRKQLTVAALQELYCAEGFAEARAAFESEAPAAGNWAIVKPGAGSASRRTEVVDEAAIAYEDYSPPAPWQPPYAVLLGSLAAARRPDYVSHTGEELIVPTQGKIRFHAYYSPGGKNPKELVLDDLAPGWMMRLNPHVPHHAWGVGQRARAWLIMRDANNTESAISVVPEVKTSAKPVVGIHESQDGNLTAEELQEPGRYALLAWGLAGKIKSYRERADLRIKDVAAACGIDHAHLSRIENGATNVSVEALIRIAKYLRVDVGEFFREGPWLNIVEPLAGTLPSGTRSYEHRCLRPQSAHLLHGKSIGIAADDRFEVDAPGAEGPSMSSLLLLGGRAIVEVDKKAELLDPGAVLHLRGKTSATIKALEDCQFMQVTFSTRCSCATG